MKALVSGGAGFIGSHLVRGLLAQGWEVAVLDNLSTGRIENLPEGVELYEGDVCDRSLVTKAVSGASVIFHLAAVASVQESLDRPMEVHDANLSGTLALLEAAAVCGVKRFVFSSSAAVYGDTGAEAAHEDMVPNPLSHYAVQKLASEYYCSVYRRLRGVESVCLRYFNIFGSRQRADSPYSGAIAKFLDAARSGKTTVIFGDGGQTRDFCHVSDVVRANIQAAMAETTGVVEGVFNVGRGESISVVQAVEEIRKLFPAMPVPRHEAGRSGEIRHSRADILKSRNVLGFEARVDFAEGLAELVASLDS